MKSLTVFEKAPNQTFERVLNIHLENFTGLLKQRYSHITNKRQTARFCQILMFCRQDLVILTKIFNLITGLIPQASCHFSSVSTTPFHAFVWYIQFFMYFEYRTIQNRHVMKNSIFLNLYLVQLYEIFGRAKEILFDRRHDEPLSIYSRFVGTIPQGIIFSDAPLWN